MVEREWRAIPQDAIRTLIDSLPRRVAACIAVRGGRYVKVIQVSNESKFRFISSNRNPISFLFNISQYVFIFVINSYNDAFRDSSLTRGFSGK
ncbi:hypothetical protein LAZ67_22000875 [Cordylochernes scorpioides]|uniref:Uncharacterized protein n=1 Tax=Cordylochernes scorpioides TaxID=51811 RepID=A0ABY6LNZ5_9ARAC|nr:hypothetical protein LAZ67_22000875 [Cordylochernes scorpioides]